MKVFFVRFGGLAIIMAMLTGFLYWQFDSPTRRCCHYQDRDAIVLLQAWEIPQGDAKDVEICRVGNPTEKVLVRPSRNDPTKDEFYQYPRPRLGKIEMGTSGTCPNGKSFETGILRTFDEFPIQTTALSLP